MPGDVIVIHNNLLARRHGATDEQVARALGRGSDTEPRSQG
ncbi:MAG: hypothetical protein ACRDTD_16565 [Pseudonocardiaceae bacterium]